MHLLTNSAPVNLGGGLPDLQPGEWLMHDANAFEIALRAERGTVKIRDSGWEELFHPDGEVLVMRSGAIGDLLMLTPCFPFIDARTGLSCFLHHWPLFQNWGGNTPKLEPYPFPLSLVNRYSHIVSLENTIEIDHEHHATDVFAKALGIPIPLKNYKPIYGVTDAEKEATKKWLFSGRPNIAIQPRASIPNRDYPGQLWGEVIIELEKRGWGILIIGRKGQVPPLGDKLKSPFIRNLAEEDLSLRESVAVLSQCDAFAGVDSSFMHFAAALDIPSVSLHGAFPWQIRTKHYPLNTALTGPGDCAGCCWHMHNGRMFPPNKPCTDKGFCVVLAGIKPERIVAKIDALKP